MIRLALLFLVALGVAWPAVARAEAPSPAAPGPAAAAASIPPDQARQTIELLKDEKRRAALIGTLETIAKAAPAKSPAGPTSLSIPLEPGSAGAQVLTAVSGFMANLSAQSRTLFATLERTPEFVRGLAEAARDPGGQALLFEAVWRLVAVMGCGLIAEWAVARALRRAQARLHRRAPDGIAGQAAEDDPLGVAPHGGDPLGVAPHGDDPLGVAPNGVAPQGVAPHGVRATAWTLLRRVPLGLAALCLDLLPVAGFAVVAHVLIGSGLGGDSDRVRLVVVAFADAYAICRVLLCLARMMLAPDDHRLRLVQVADPSARYAVRWLRRIVAVAVFGYAVAAAGLLLGMSQGAHETALKLVGLLVHGMLVVVVLQKRAAVARRLRAPKRAKGAWAALRNRFAAIWHWVALFYLVGTWVIWAVELPNGFARLVQVAASTAAVLVIGRLVLIVVLGSLDRAARAGTGPDEAPTALQARLLAYMPVLRSGFSVLVYGLTALALLQSWGLGTLTWLISSNPGQRVLASLAGIGVTLLLALLAWEAANAAVERQLARLAREEQPARTARLRTLLPLLRTTLLIALVIVVGLMLLSEVGVNIAPLLAGAGVLGIAIGFGSQKLVQDVITGLFLLLENTVQVGDVVTLGGASGVVEHLSIRSIRLRDEDGSVHVIPFSAVTTVTNMTRDFSQAVIQASISYKDDYDKVVPLLQDIVREMRAEPRWAGEISDDLEVWGLDKFGDSAVTIKARIRCGPFARWSVLREFNRRMKRRFEEHGIQIPYPHQQLVLPPSVPLGADANASAASARPAVTRAVAE